MGFRRNWYQIGNKTCYILCKTFCVEKGMYVNWLESVNFGMYFTARNIMQKKEDPLESNFEGHQIQKQTFSTDRAQRADEKNGVICLVITFTPRVMVIRMLKMANFLYFLLMMAKN